VFIFFAARHYAQGEVMPQFVVCPSVCLSVCYVQVCFSHRLEYFENNFSADYLKDSTRADPNKGDLVQREQPQN